MEFEEDSPVSNLFSSVMNWLKPQQEEKDNQNKGQFNEVAKSIEAIAQTFGDTLKELNELKKTIQNFKMILMI